MLFSSAFPAMFGTFIKYQFQRTYDAILAAPVDTEELVTAEALWIAHPRRRLRLRADARRDGLRPDPAWGMLAVPVIAFLAGFGWACFGISIAGFASSIENFNYIISAVLTPLFLVAGTFFPLDQLPEWAQFLAPQPALPLRRARSPRRLRLRGLDDLAARRAHRLRPGHLAVAIHAMTRKLVD